MAGAGILGLGIYVLGSDYGAKELSSILGNDLYQVAAYVLIGTGALLVILSICGCCGAHRESKCMLGFVSIPIRILRNVIINSCNIRASIKFNEKVRLLRQQVHTFAIQISIQVILKHGK